MFPHENSFQVNFKMLVWHSEIEFKFKEEEFQNFMILISRGISCLNPKIENYIIK